MPGTQDMPRVAAAVIDKTEHTACNRFEVTALHKRPCACSLLRDG
jgi:hypothetical protein